MFPKPQKIISFNLSPNEMSVLGGKQVLIHCLKYQRLPPLHLFCVCVCVPFTSPVCARGCGKTAIFSGLFWKRCVRLLNSKAVMIIIIADMSILQNICSACWNKKHFHHLLFYHFISLSFHRVEIWRQWYYRYYRWMNFVIFLFVWWNFEKNSLPFVDSICQLRIKIDKWIYKCNPVHYIWKLVF